MNFWLVKSEPEAWSWQDQVKKGVEPWTGVRNHQAAKNLKSMKKGDQVFFYHSVTERAIVGVVEVVREAYPDPTDETGKWVCVDVKTVKPLAKPVTLEAIKSDPRLVGIPLIRQSRLSVMGLDQQTWDILMDMSKA